MRYSTVELTIGLYTHSDLLDPSVAVNKLPALPMIDPTPQNERQTLRATRTNDKNTVPPTRHSVLVARMIARPDEKTGFLGRDSSYSISTTNRQHALVAVHRLV